MLIAIIASTGVNRQQLAKAFRISGTTVERVVTQWHRGGLKAVAEVVQSLHKQWLAERAAAAASPSAELVQVELPSVASNDRSAAAAAESAAPDQDDDLACLDEGGSAPPPPPPAIDLSVDSAEEQSAAGLLKPVVDSAARGPSCRSSR